MWRRGDVGGESEEGRASVKMLRLEQAGMLGERAREETIVVCNGGGGKRGRAACGDFTPSVRISDD